MSTLVDCPATLVATPRLRASVTGARLLADDAQPRLERSFVSPAFAAWRHQDVAVMRGLEIAGRTTTSGRTAIAGGAYLVTNVTKQQHSTRSGPPTSRPPA